MASFGCDGRGSADSRPITLVGFFHGSRFAGRLELDLGLELAVEVLVWGQTWVVVDLLDKSC